ERAMVGTTYKHEGREKAITQGLELVGPKMAEFVAEGKRILQEHQAANITMHCWRGGMRSKSMATLFNFAGIPTLTITGGYKVYRNAVQQSFANPLHLIVLGGKTGSAKTAILQALQQQGEQIIDLEKLANHKGSAFGQLGEDPQPSSEYFENLLFEKIQQLDSTKRIWIEDESHLIGKVFIPETFWEQMRNAQVIYCDFPIEERINYLVTTYGNFDHEGVIESVKRITKKLGGQHAKAALEAYEAGDLKKATEIVLVYYDKTYNFGLSKRNPAQVKQMDMQKIEPWENAKMLIADLFN
ncbi:MAG: tRNA 2-selenouridine(34) synthase MnmH, partial [Chitinophagales bacterium]|nr:tRNA 2-selenouridine(34) synthase MnmH [Chitinophagales bacterium]